MPIVRRYRDTDVEQVLSAWENTQALAHPFLPDAFQNQEATSYAVFGSLDFHLGEKWDLTAGLRYTNDEKDFSAERPDPTFQLPTFEPITKHTDADNVSWDLSATYKANSNVNIYGRVATGFRAPSIQGRILFCADFEGGLNPDTNCVTVADSEEIISYEIGAKTILADNKLRLNVAAYNFEVTDQQITAIGGVNNTAILLNAPINIRYALDVTNIQVWALHNPVHYVPMTNRQRGLYARSLEQIEHNLALLRPGLAFADFNELSWRLPERFAAQRYSCAIHGVGMADEWPTVPMHDNDAHAHGGGFATDMTVCVESYTGEVSGPDAIQLETQVLISETGGVRLDSFPFEGH